MQVIIALILAANLIVTYRVHQIASLYTHQPKAKRFQLKSITHWQSHSSGDSVVVARIYNLQTLDDLQSIREWNVISINPVIVQARFRSISELRSSVPANVTYRLVGE